MPASRRESLAGRRDLPLRARSPSGGHRTISVSEEWRVLDFFSFPFYSSAFSHGLLLPPLRHSSESSGGSLAPAGRVCKRGRCLSYFDALTHAAGLAQGLLKCGAQFSKLGGRGRLSAFSTRTQMMLALPVHGRPWAPLGAGAQGIGETLGGGGESRCFQV